MMKSIDLHRKIYNKDILVSMAVTGTGTQIFVTGGDKPHIGAVTVIDPSGQENTICFPNHREDVIATKWAKRIYNVTSQPVVVSAGIHFDNASKEMIAEVVAETDLLLKEVSQLIIDMV